MFSSMPALTHEQQQKAVERIQELMAQGLSSAEAIALVAKHIRESHQGDSVHAIFTGADDESDDS